MRYDIDRIMFNISDNIAEVMRRKCFTAARLSRESGISYRSIYYYKTGMRVPTIENAMRMANALGVDLNELIGAKNGR